MSIYQSEKSGKLKPNMQNILSKKTKHFGGKYHGDKPEHVLDLKGARTKAIHAKKEGKKKGDSIRQQLKDDRQHDSFKAGYND